MQQQQLQRRLLNGENMQIGNKAPCGQNNAYFTLKIACLIVMIMNKKNLKARISKKGKYHIAHIQMPQSMVKILISSLTTKIVVLVEVRNTYYISIYKSITYFQYSPITIAIDSNPAIVNSSNG